MEVSKDLTGEECIEFRNVYQGFTGIKAVNFNFLGI